MNDLKKIGNVIQFPGTRNEKLDDQEDMVYQNASKINNLMLGSREAFNSVNLSATLLLIFLTSKLQFYCFGLFFPSSKLDLLRAFKNLDC